MAGKKTVGSFTLIKNEAEWIGAHLMAWLPLLDQMVFLDGNSTDDTRYVIDEVREKHPLGSKIVLWVNSDPADLRDDYVRVQNKALAQLGTNYAVFLHPDMFPLSVDDRFGNIGVYHAYAHGMKSYAGEPGEKYMYEISEGRGAAWKNVMRKRDPDLGLHYHGHYGAANEDMYFSAITGDEHEFHGTKFERYPYAIGDSGLVIAHFSDVRPLERRISRMASCLVNQGWDPEKAKKYAPTHPRVSFDSRDGFVFNQIAVPAVLTEAQAAYRAFLRGIKEEQDKFLKEVSARA